MITVENLTRKYGGLTAVDDVSFVIGRGEIVGLLGHNGAGKTTIMKMLTGYLEPTAGSITIDGQELTSNRRLIQARIGYLPENCPLYPEMTVIDYLDYCASLHAVSDSQRDALVLEALEKTGLKDKAGQPISTLSRGYRQRTGVAQAILHRPELLILDEPTNGLDPTQIQQMRAMITSLAESATVIVSTHILQEVQAICDRVIIMKDGRKALDTRLDELQKGARLQLRFAGASEKAGELLAAVPGIAEVLSLATASDVVTARLALQSGEDRQQTAGRVADTIWKAGWQLFSLQEEVRSLETVFAEAGASQGGMQ